MTNYRIKTEWAGNAQFNPVKSLAKILHTSNPKFYLIISTTATVYDLNTVVTITVKVTDSHNNLLSGLTPLLNITDPSNQLTQNTLSSTDSNGLTTYNLTLSKKGAYILTATLPNTTNYSAGVSDTYTITAGKPNTNIVMSLNKTNINFGEVLTITNTCTTINDTNQPLLANRVIHNYYKLGTNDPVEIPLTTNINDKSNKNGLQTIQFTPVHTGNYTFYSIFEGDTSYEACTSNNMSVTVNKTDTVIGNITGDTMYPNWHLRCQLSTINGLLLSNQPVTVTLTYNTSTPTTITKNINTDTNGIIEVNDINTSNNISVDYTIVYNGNDYYNTSTLNDTFTIKSSIIKTYTPKLVENMSNQIPYKMWNNLGAGVLHDGVNYLRCGHSGWTPVSPIATYSGSYNTPSTLKLSDFGVNIPSNSSILNVRVRFYIRNIATDGVHYPFTSSDSPIIQYNNMKDTSVLPLNDSSINNTWALGQAIWTNTNGNIKTSDINNNNNNVLIQFPQNKTGSTGYLDIDYMELYIEYIPVQEDGVLWL